MGNQNLNDDIDEELELDEELDRGNELDEELDEGEELDDGLDPEDLKALADDKPSSVPHARFNEVNEALKEERSLREQMQRRLDALEQRNAPKEEEELPEFDFDAKEDEYNDALMEGDTVKAKQIRAEIRKADRELIAAQMEQRVTERISQQEATRLFMEEAERVVDKYPFLADGENQNKKAVDEVKEWRDFYMQKGDAAHTALRKAANKVAPMYADDSGDPDDKTAVLSVAELRRRQKAKAMQRNADASSKQPPPLKGGSGERSSKRDLNINDLSDDEYDNLTAAEKKRLRGDDAV